MARRGGGFGGIGLDPFGSGSSSLSRYNLGETVSSLEALDAYAIALGWQNGTVSDAEYVASLKRQIEFQPEGSKDRLTAQDRYDDAVYTIGRNKIVNAINASKTTAERTSLTKNLIAADEARAKQMDPSNEQYREIEAKIASSRADIRQAEYGDMVDKANSGKATNEQLLAIAQRNYAAAGDDPDSETWRKAIGDLHDRIADARIDQGYQDYQHNRISGSSLLKMIDQRLGDMQAGSPAYIALQHQREDLADNVKQKDRAVVNANVDKARNAGKITDGAYIAALKADIDKTDPGSSERVNAEDRLRQAVFSLGEDKLRYDVQNGKAGSVNKLISFYKSYQATMVNGSAEWRSIDLAISSLKGRSTGGSGGGGGSRSGGGSGSGSAGLPGKVVVQTGDFGALVNGNLPGVTVPKDLGGLLGINPTDKAQLTWFNQNRIHLQYAQSHGMDTWTYQDTKGGLHQLPFTPSMLQTIEQANIGNLQTLATKATDPYKRQLAVGRLVTALQQYRDTGGQIAVGDYRKNMAIINDRKAQALGAGDYATYLNLTLAQQNLIRAVLMVPEGAPTDASLSQNPVLDANDIAMLKADLDKIDPAVDDPSLPTYHPGGDKVLASMMDGTINVRDENHDGIVDAAVLDPYRAYVTQDSATGQVTFVKLSENNPGDYVNDAETGERKPAYLNTHVLVSTWDGQQFYQPTQENAAGAPGALTLGVRIVTNVNTANQPPSGAQLAANAQGGVVPNPNAATGFMAFPAQAQGPGEVRDPNTGFYSYLAKGGVNLPAVSVLETGNDGKKRTVWWVTVDGVNYTRMEASGGAATPQLVVNADRVGAVSFANGVLTINGKAYDPKTDGVIGQYLHIYGEDYTGADGYVHRAPEATGAGEGIGGPGQYFLTRKITPDGLMVSSNYNVHDPNEDRVLWDAKHGQSSVPDALPGQRNDVNAYTGFVTGTQGTPHVNDFTGFTDSQRTSPDINPSTGFNVGDFTGKKIPVDPLSDYQRALQNRTILHYPPGTALSYPLHSLAERDIRSPAAGVPVVSAQTGFTLRTEPKPVLRTPDASRKLALVNQEPLDTPKLSAQTGFRLTPAPKPKHTSKPDPSKTLARVNREPVSPPKVKLPANRGTIASKAR